MNQKLVAKGWHAGCNYLASHSSQTGAMFCNKCGYYRKERQGMSLGMTLGGISLMLVVALALTCW